MRAQQRGVTLISLMVGLMISMILVLATLTLFQRMTRETLTARTDTQVNAQRSSSFLVSGIELQGAGYGIDPAQPNTHLVLLSDASFDRATGTLTGTPTTIPTGAGSAPATGNAVVWSENVGGASLCSVLFARPPALGDAGALKSALYQLGPLPCADAATLATPGSSNGWTAVRALADEPTTPVTIAVQSSVACAPFGIPAGSSGNLQVSLSASNSNGVVLSTSQCLLNFPT